MISWIYASESDKELFNAIASIFWHKEYLLTGLFQKDFPGLTAPADELLTHYKQKLSREELLLVQVALDLWDNAGGALLKDIVNADKFSFIKIINSTVMVKQSRSLILSF